MWEYLIKSLVNLFVSLTGSCKQKKNKTKISSGELARHQPSVRPTPDLLFHLFCRAGEFLNTPIHISKYLYSYF